MPRQLSDEEQMIIENELRLGREVKQIALEMGISVSTASKYAAVIRARAGELLVTDARNYRRVSGHQHG